MATQTSSGRTALIITAVGTLVGVPVVLGTLRASWSTINQDRRVALGPVGVAPPSDGPRDMPEVLPLELPPAAERSVTSVVLDLLEMEPTAPHGDDLDPSLPYRIAWDAPDGHYVTTATVDLGRDGTVDEWWTLRPELAREIVEGGQKIRMVMRDGVWAPQ